MHLVFLCLYLTAGWAVMVGFLAEAAVRQRKEDVCD